MKLKIKVTKEILQRASMCGIFGFEEVGSHCAIALAIRDIAPNAWVTLRQVWWCGVNKSLGFSMASHGIISCLPDVAVDFIEKFDGFLSKGINNIIPLCEVVDKRRAMNELEFEVDVPDEYISTINIEEVKKVLDNHTTLELI